MSSEDLAEDTGDQEEGFELDSDSSDDLEMAMQEALEAVEKAGGDLGAEKTASSRPRREGAAQAGSEAGDVSMLEAEVAELKDRFMRTMADFENFRKRVERERADEKRYANAEILKEFLKIIDNLERAVASEGPEEDFRTGVELILRQMHELLQNAGVRRVEAAGEEFDPRYHEAVSKHESSAVSIPTVSDEMQSGYELHDRLLRPSIVKVAMPTGGGEGADEEGEGDSGR